MFYLQFKSDLKLCFDYFPEATHPRPGCPNLPEFPLRPDQRPRKDRAKLVCDYSAAGAVSSAEAASTAGAASAAGSAATAASTAGAAAPANLPFSTPWLITTARSR